MAYDYSVKELGGKLSLERLLLDAAEASKEGIAVTNTLRNNLRAKAHQLEDIPNFKDIYFKDGKIPNVGDKLQFNAMSKTFFSLIKNGLDDFYSGEIAEDILSDLETLGSPLKKIDFDNYAASFVNPLELEIKDAKLFNLPPPTQGLASILILGVLDELTDKYENDTDLIHKIVEATKVVFKIRDKYVCDPNYMTKKTSDFLNKDFIRQLVNKIDLNKALPWPDANVGGDTVWLGASDSYGNTVSFIQSIYWEFGSGLILPKTGITMQNRGISFSLEKENFNKLLPFRKPFHTIQPALAHFNDGRVMAYGTMGGEGQPQTQATIFLRYAIQNLDLQKAINEPRWLLGRTWGDETTSLKIEGRFNNSTLSDLKNLGHIIEKVGDFEEIMGHAGAIVDHPNGLKEGGYDLRSDGDAIGG
jgi:gamma-glutamyltranspeptidase/glutathione hydrolase